MRAAVEVEAVVRGLSVRRLGLGIQVGLRQNGEVAGRSWERLWGQMPGMEHAPVNTHTPRCIHKYTIHPLCLGVN